jgi:NitT/TauT family transport system substrate-binding protein
MMVYDKPAVRHREYRKVQDQCKPKDLEGKVLGAPPPDGAFAQWVRS